MAKTSGGVRSLGSRTKAKANRKAEFEAMLASGKYSKNDCYFDNKSGGYYLTEKSRTKHKNEEIEVARHLANKGYKVVLIDEAGSTLKIDGKIFSVSYEQKTPEGSTHKNMNKALEHAKSKRADIAVVYMKHNKHSRASVEQGIAEYEKLNDYRFNRILVVTKDGRIHIHKHNK